MSSPKLPPALMPDRTRVGGLPLMIDLMARSTQSVGVPSTAKRRGLILRMRSGRRSVSEWLAPLCSCSGATTQTSGQSWRATFSRRRSPGALMPSSFEIRMRAEPRSIGRSNIAADHLHPSHIGPQRLGHGNGAVLPLIIFEDGDQRAPDSEPRSVERVHEARPLPVLRPEARLHAPRLEVAAIGAARDLAVGSLARQPDLDVVGLARGEPHIAGAEQHHPVGKAEALQHRLGAGRHALMLLARAVGMRDRDQLDLAELVLADHAARVLAGGAGLRAEAWRPRGEAERQLLLLDDAVHR